MSGTRRAALRVLAALVSARAPETSEANASRLAPVASSTLATLSVLGQRLRPSGIRRLDGLNVVGSSPERRARPEAERPFSAASVSSARQMSSCFIVRDPHVVAPLWGRIGDTPVL